MAATHGSIFNAMLQEFDGAARILNLEPGIWKILTHETPDHGLVSIQMTTAIGSSPATASSSITLGPAGRHPLSPGRHLDEVTALAAWMTGSAPSRTSRSAAARGVICDPTKMSKRDR
jgi:hypothetical protein